MKKYRDLSKYARTNLKTYGLVIIAFALLFPLQSAGMPSTSLTGQMIPITVDSVLGI